MNARSGRSSSVNNRSSRNASVGDLQLLRALCDPDNATLTGAEVGVLVLNNRDTNSHTDGGGYSSSSPSGVGTGVLVRPRSPVLRGMDREGVEEVENLLPNITSYKRETIGERNQIGRVEAIYPRLSGAFRGSTASILRKKRSILTASS